MIPDPLVERHTSEGPKRMLALDGGGIRGILSLGYLKAIEDLLRKRHKKPELVLADYFDIVGGTSTGAIIAASLAIGNSVDDIIALYRSLGDSIFKKRFWRRGLLFTKFKVKPLEEALADHFGDITFSDPSIRTGLMIVVKRWDTGSPWVLHNIRGSNYYQKYTKGYILRDVVRASTAAPSYFRPEYLEIKPGESGAFVDGGVTPHNNPAFQMFMLARLKRYGLDWEAGEDRLFLVSVGTGGSVPEREPRSWKNRLAFSNGLTSLKMMMDDATALDQMLLQWLSHSPTAHEIDKEIGNLADDNLAKEYSLSYVRYNAILNSVWLGQIGMKINSKTARKLSRMDDAGNLSLLQQIGEQAAAHQVCEDHFRAPFDLHD